MAANKAILHATLQVLEAKDVYDKGKGQLVVTAATKAGADALRQTPHIKFGIEGMFCVTLMPKQKTDNTFRYAIVGDKVDEVSFTTIPLLQHFCSLCGHAKQQGQQMAKSAMITTPAEDVNLYFWTDDSKVVAAGSIDAVNIATITFVPAGHSLACMPKGFVRDKAGSLGGLSPMWKPADQLTATLLLGASASKKDSPMLGGKPVRYTTSNRSGVGSTKPNQDKSSILTACVAGLAMARDIKASDKELHLWLTDSMVLKHELKQAWQKMPRQHLPQAIVAESDDSPDIMGALVPGPSPDHARAGLVRARNEVSSVQYSQGQQHCACNAIVCSKHTLSKQNRTIAVASLFSNQVFHTWCGD